MKTGYPDTGVVASPPMVRRAAMSSCVQAVWKKNFVQSSIQKGMSVVFLSFILCAKRKKENRQPKGGMGLSCVLKKERKKTHNPREGWENGTPPPHRDFKERSVVR